MIDAIDALRAINPGLPREEWVKAAMAAKAAGIDFETFDRWSAEAPNYGGRADTAAVWRSIKPEGGISERTLYAMAREAGWRPKKNGHPRLNGHARLDVASVWSGCEPATAEHPYIRKKQGLPDGLRMVPKKSTLRIAGKSVAGWLAVPARDLDGRLQTVQFISPEGEKLSLPGASFGEGLHVIGDLREADCCYIVEGIGQAWACWRATSRPAACTFGAGRFRVVAEALRKRYPDLRLVLVPDKGKEAQAEILARELGCEVVRMPEDKPANYDANDLYQEHGAEALAELLERTERPGTRRALLVPASDLTRLPARIDWLIRDYIEREALALLFGDPGTAKSFMALSWAVAIATGTAWHGHKVAKGPAVYVAGEGHAGLARRLKALEVRHGLNLADAPLYISRRAVPMLDDAAVDALIAELDSLPAPPVFITLDTVARSLAGGEENSAADVGAFIGACDRLRARYRSAVLLVHHAGHGDKSRARGSSALRAAVDTEMGLSRLQDAPDVLCLSCTKMKDAEPFLPRYFELERVPLPWADDEGNPLDSAVLVASDYRPAEEPVRARGKHQTQALAVLRQQLTEYRERLESAGYPPEQARVSMADWREALRQAGMDRRRIHQAIESLVQNGLVREEGIYVTPIA